MEIVTCPYHLVDSFLAYGLERLKSRLKSHFPKNNTFALIFFGERYNCLCLRLVALLGEAYWLIFVFKSAFTAIERTTVFGGRLLIQQFLKSELVQQYLAKYSDELGAALKCLEYISFQLLLNLLLVQFVVLVYDFDDIVIVVTVKFGLKGMLLKLCLLHLFKLDLQVCCHGLIDPIINRSLCFFWDLIEQVCARRVAFFLGQDIDIYIGQVF